MLVKSSRRLLTLTRITRLKIISFGPLKPKMLAQLIWCYRKQNLWLPNTGLPKSQSVINTRRLQASPGTALTLASSQLALVLSASRLFRRYSSSWATSKSMSRTTKCSTLYSVTQAKSVIRETPWSSHHSTGRRRLLSNMNAIWRCARNFTCVTGPAPSSGSSRAFAAVASAVTKRSLALRKAQLSIGSTR